MFATFIRRWFRSLLATAPRFRNRIAPRQLSGIASLVRSLESRQLLSANPVAFTNFNPVYHPFSGTDPAYEININGSLFFSGEDSAHGRELWKSDGTIAGTVLVKDINPNSAKSNPGNFVNVNGVLFYTADDGVHGKELWKSDGTTAGTVLVKDLNGTANSSSPYSLTNVNGTLFFVGYDGPNHGRELWKSDGTTAGTVMVKDIYPGSNTSYPQYLTNMNGVLYFSANDGNLGTALWKSDGTATGTVMVEGNVAILNEFTPKYLTNVNGTLFYQAKDSNSNGAELWKSDGTAAGTVLVKNIVSSPSTGSYPRALENINGTLYFSANDGSTGHELWRSDGTTAGTTQVKDINLGLADSNPGGLTNLNGMLYFTADDTDHGQELWRSDGTVAGTMMVSDIMPGPYGSGITPNPYGPSEFSSLININGRLFFVASDGMHGQELWQSDGTSSGTSLVTDINPGSGGGLLEGPMNFNGQVVFTAMTNVTGGELWKLFPPPILAGTSQLIVSPGQSASAINTILTVSDPNFSTLSKATVAITNFVAGQDLLGLVPNALSMGNITGNFDSTTGILTLTSSGATATIAQFQTALRAVTYSNSSGNPYGAPREVAYRVSDGTIFSDPLKSTISFKNLIDHAPTSLTLSANAVGDDKPIGTTVGTFSTVDPDYTPSFIYSLASGGDNAAFMLDANGTLKTAVSLDATVKKSYTITATSTDPGNLSITKSFTIDVSPVINHAPVVNPATFNLPENSPNATVVGTVVATEVDVGQTLTYKLTAGNTNTAFAINSATGRITVANTAALNFETMPSFSLTVQATDNASPAKSATATVKITLTNVNEPPVFPSTGFDLPENSAVNTVVGKVTATDPDVGQTVTYVITGGNGAGSFAINSTTGQITVANGAALDYEVTPVFNLTVTATDNAPGVPLSSSATVSVHLTNIDETTVLSGSSLLAYVKNQPATPIDPGILVTDVDTATLAEARVWLTNFYQRDDLLNLVTNPATMGNITSAFNTTSGVLTLISTNATATLAQFQAALRSVTYFNRSGANANVAPRFAKFVVEDKTQASNTLSCTIGIGSPPALSGAGLLTYAKNQVATAISPALVLNDVDHPVLTSATVKLTNYFSKDDVLGFVANPATMGNITGGFSTTSGILTLTSPGATVVQFQAALRAVTYYNRSGANANVAPRYVAYQVSDGTLTSNLLTSTIGIGSPPTLAVAGTLIYMNSQAATAISPALVVSDVDHPQLASATVTLTNFYARDDVLGFVNNNSALFGNIIGGFSTTTGILTLASSGRTATVAQFQAALRAVTYFNRSGANANTATRFAAYQISDGTLFSKILTSTITFA